MIKITKKHFIELLINNKSEFLLGQYVYNHSANDILEHLKAVNYKDVKGERRQGFKHSKGLKFLKNDGSYSYADNLINYDYYKIDNVLTAIKQHTKSINVLVYRVV